MTTLEIEKLKRFVYNKLAIYTPEFEPNSFEYIRFDISVYVVDVTGFMNSKEPITLNLYEASGIYPQVKGNEVVQYRILLPKWVIEANLNIYSE